MRRRLFVAVDVDDAARAACAGVAERLRAKGFDAKWVDPRNYHLTVAFLGGVDEERVSEVVSALEQVAPRIGGFTLPLDAVGAYPNERKARVAWVGPSAEVGAFGTLCGAVRSALVAAGFSFDRDADPHVTLARASGRYALPPVPPPVTAPVAVDALTLYQSFTEPSGARYVPLQRFPLGCAPGL
ncbi:MAG TPA: RNA 2',3'-cyclic phosphodiesterase [Candidatus Elarobacter sp.]|nr:RNA 2',3'-cyclic phosphodiesterase [Candidatus Elarobacter sp.]